MAKHILFIFFIVCNAHTSFAQKIHISDSTNVWNYLSKDGDEYYETASFTTLCFGDTSLVNGQVFREVLSDGYSDTYWRSGWTFDTSSWSDVSLGFLREDTANGLVLFYNGTLDTIYDYNHTIGDSLYNGNCKASVVSIDSVQINAVYHRVWNYNSFNTIGKGYENEDYYVIEGLGSLLSLQHIVNTGFCPSSISYFYRKYPNLKCFRNNGVNVVLSSPVSRFDNTSSCLLSVDDTQPPTQLKLRVVPNPATSNSYIEFPYNITGHIAVYDVTGRLIASDPVSNVTQYTLANKLHSPGFYVYILLAKDGSMATGRFVYED
jgi:hypothetical protein